MVTFLLPNLGRLNCSLTHCCGENSSSGREHDTKGSKIVPAKPATRSARILFSISGPMNCCHWHYFIAKWFVVLGQEIRSVSDSHNQWSNKGDGSNKGVAALLFGWSRPL